MVSYFYPPVKAVGTMRNYYVSELFRQQGYDVTVYAGKPLGYLGNEALPINASIKVKRTWAFDYHLFDKIRKRRAQQSTPSTTIPSKGNIPWIYYFPFNILVGEGGVIYGLLVLLRLLINIRKTDIVWSSYSPLIDHYVSSIVKRVKPSVVWITDWRDVDVDPDWPESKKTDRQRKINKAVIGKSDLAVAVSESYMQHVDHYGRYRYVLRNGIMDKFDASGCPLDDKFSISYVGGLYGGRRDPSVVFKTLQRLVQRNELDPTKLSLVYAGREGGLYQALAAKYGLGDCVDNRGLVSFAASQKLQRSAQVNLMISWSSGGMSTFPAKFYEYVNARRPILLLVLGNEDLEFEAIFKTKEIGEMFYDREHKKLEQYLDRQYKSWDSAGVVPYEGSEADVEEFYWKDSFAVFDQYLRKMYPQKFG